MESLSAEIWDVVIAGTSLPQSLLALSLSRSGLKILHVDENSYYGGDDAGLSLDDARSWCKNRTDTTLEILRESELKPSRAYTLSLKPQVIYAKSQILPALVSSQLHSQLEFQAVGSTYILKHGQLQKIPSSREDVFADQTLSMKDKRKLMRLLRYVLEQEEDSAPAHSGALADVLDNEFKIPDEIQSAVLALSLTSDAATNTSFRTALDRVRRHLQSIGYFGPGMAAVTAKYGGNSEIAQVSCRACAVGGGVYLLGQGVKKTSYANTDDLLEITLSNDVAVRAKLFVGAADDKILRDMCLSQAEQHVAEEQIAHSISIVSRSLVSLFSASSENGPTPAVATVLVDDRPGQPPIYLQVHSEDSGECPREQCIIYTSTKTKGTLDTISRMTAAVDQVLQTFSSVERPEVIWRMQYTTSQIENATAGEVGVIYNEAKNVMAFSSRPHDIAFDDAVLTSVKTMWQRVLGDAVPDEDFLQFPAREDQSEE